MRILVTGGRGFIGSHTCDRLVEQGHAVVVHDAPTPPVHRDGQPNHLTPGADRFTEVNVTSAALHYELIVSEQWDLARAVAASSEACTGTSGA